VKLDRYVIDAATAGFRLQETQFVFRAVHTRKASGASCSRKLRVVAVQVILPGVLEELLLQRSVRRFTGVDVRVPACLRLKESSQSAIARVLVT
jgi:hypothetical protein